MKKNIIISLLLVVPMMGASPQTSKEVRSRLDSTLVEKLEPLNHFTIEEVMPILYRLSLDSKGKGINFIFNQNINKPAQVTPAVPQVGVDPITGLPQQPNMRNEIPQTPQPNGALPGLGVPPMLGLFLPAPLAVGNRQQIKIKGLSVPLHNITLKQVLDICVMSFDYPVTYTVMDYGVVFMRKDISKPTNFYYRTFRINPNRLVNPPVFRPSLSGGQSRTNSINNGQIR